MHASKELSGLDAKILVIVTYIFYRDIHNTQVQLITSAEITREDSHDSATKKDSSKQFVKSDSVESSKTTKQTSEQSADRDTSKYSARMDSRDGYRDDSRGSTPRASRDHNGDSSENIHKHSRESKSPLGASSSNSNSNGKHAKSASPATRNSPRARESPRSQSSPKQGRRDPSPREGRPMASPRSKGKNSAKSPVPSPNSKSNTKPHGYPEVEPLELSKVSSIDKEQGDMNFESDDDSITGEINPPVDDNRVRLFVALFDYDPESMSPNVDSLDEELPFREGNIIKVCTA